MRSGDLVILCSSRGRLSWYELDTGQYLHQMLRDLFA